MPEHQAAEKQASYQNRLRVGKATVMLMETGLSLEDTKNSA
jgi:hypothetical protein